MTNGDRIRAMTDEDMAYLLQDYSSCCGFKRCPAFVESCGVSEITCIQAWLDWLKMEGEG